MAPYGRPEKTALYVNYRLDDMILSLVRDGALDWSAFSRETQRQHSADREWRKHSPIRDIDRFRRLLAGRMRVLGWGPPDEDECMRFSSWLVANVRRCPGAWLHYRAHEELIRNTGDQPKIGDLADWSHANCVPYVDAVTFDRRILAYMRRGAEKVAKTTPDLDFTRRIFKNLAEILAGC